MQSLPGHGIGKAIAVAYVKAGASIVCAARTAAEIEKTANEIAKIGERALAVKTDLTYDILVVNYFFCKDFFVSYAILFYEVRLNGMVGKNERCNQLHRSTY